MAAVDFIGACAFHQIVLVDFLTETFFLIGAGWGVDIAFPMCFTAAQQFEWGGGIRWVHFSSDVANCLAEGFLNTCVVQDLSVKPGGKFLRSQIFNFIFVIDSNSIWDVEFLPDFFSQIPGIAGVKDDDRWFGLRFGGLEV